MDRVNLDSIPEYEQQYPQHTQSAADRRSAYYVALEVQRTQDALLEAEKERIAEENSEEDISIDELMEDYAEEDKYKEYLVEGATLGCSMATLDDFQVPDGRIIKLRAEEGKKAETRVQTTLHVLENPMSVNGLKYATVKDTMIYQNIFPFQCNCKLAADRGEEVDKIIADKDCGSHGVCRHLMELNEEWDNMLFDGVSYLKRVWAAPRGIAGIIAPDSKIQTEEAEGITMTSVLFCKHGGLIYPVTSGQEIIVSNETVPIFYTEAEIYSDIKKGLYTWEDFTYLVATVSGEADIYEGYVAVAYEVLNRCRLRGKSVKEIVTPDKQYTGFDESLVGIMPDDMMVRGAVVAVLRGEVENPIGDIEYHYGRVNGYDLWYDKETCKIVIVIGEGSLRNVFFEPYGSVHNMVNISTENKENAVVIYSNDDQEWKLDGAIKREE